MKDQTKQQVDVIVRMTFEADAEIEKDVVVHQLEHWISETMALMDDAEEQYAYIDSQIVYAQEEAEIYSPKESLQTDPCYFAFGENLVAVLESGKIYQAKRHLKVGNGSLHKFHAYSASDILAA